MAGWIKVYRSISKHWIWENERYLKAWLTILMTVNFEPKKVLIQGELIDCNRGQSLHSLASWTKVFGKSWTIQRVRTFLNLLEKDKMILLEGLRKTTRLTVCNYESYQDLQQTDNTQTTDKQQANNTRLTHSQQQLKNDKKDNNEKNEQEKQIDVLFETFWNAYDKKVNKPKCEKKFKSLSIDEITDIINHVPAYVKSTPDKKFRKDPLTYLNNRAWEDEITKSSGGIRYESWYRPGDVEHIII